MSSEGGDDPRDSESLRLLIENGVRPDDARQVLANIKENFGIAVAPAPAAPDPVFQFRRTTKKRANQNHTVAGAPFEKFQAHAAEHQWLARSNNDDVFDFIEDVYGEWIDRGLKARQPLCRADLKAVDLPLWERLSSAVGRRKGMPEWLYLPTAKEAALVGISEEEARIRLATREHFTRARHAALERAVQGGGIRDTESHVGDQFGGAATTRLVTGVPFKDFKAYAAARQFSTRQAHGYAKDCNIWAFVHAAYGIWIERGVKAGQPLTQEDIRDVDSALFGRLQRSIAAGGQPVWLYLPTRNEECISLDELELRLEYRPKGLRLMGKRAANETSNPSSQTQP